MISLILTTNNRPDDFVKFCESLSNHEIIQLVVVDQNIELDYVTVEIEKLRLKGVDTLHLQRNPMSLSRARNIGLKYVKHKIIGFPDDDCIYSEKVISEVKNIFYSNPDESLICFTNAIKLNTNTHMVKLLKLSRFKLLKNLISYTCFFNFEGKDVIYFDERMGVGTRFSSAEETDFAYRFLNDVVNKNSFIFVQGIEIVHPLKEANLDIIREKKYALGLGAFSRKNFEMSYRYFYFYYLKPLWINPIGLFFISVLMFSFSGIKKGLIRLIYRNLGFYKFRKKQNE